MAATLDLVLQARDEASASIQSLSANIKRLAAELGPVGAANRAYADQQRRAAQATTDFAGATRALQQSLMSLPGPMGAVTSQVMTLSSFLTGPAGIVAGFTAAATAATAAGIQFNSRIEQQKLGIASVVAATNTIVDAQGQQLDGIGKINAAQRITSDLYKAIQRDAAVTVATTDELVRAFQATVAPASAAGLTLDQTRQVTKDIVLAWGAMGRPMEMVNQEARALLSGTIDRNAELARALGITSEMVNTAKAEGRLYEFLTDKLRIFSQSADLVGNTFSGLLSTLTDIAQILTAQAFTGVFGTMREEVQKVRDALMDSAGQLRPEIVERVEAIGRGLTVAANAAVKLGEASGVFFKAFETDMKDLEQAATLVERIGRAWDLTSRILTGNVKQAADLVTQWRALAEVQANPPHEIVRPGVRAPAQAIPGDLLGPEADVRATQAATEAAKALADVQGLVLEKIEQRRQASLKAAEDERTATLTRVQQIESIPGLAEDAARRRHEAESLYLTKTVTAEMKAAADRREIIAAQVTAVLPIIKGLGDEFAGLGKGLDVADFLRKTGDQIKGLEALRQTVAGNEEAFKKLGITQADLSKAIDTLQQRAADAVKTGMVPLAESASKVGDSLKTLTEFAIQNSAALANFSKSVQETDRAIRALLDEGLETRAFDEMGREIDSLTTEIQQINQEFQLGEARVLAFGNAITGVTQQITAAAQATTQLGTAANTFFQASQTPSITGSSLAGLQGSGPGGLVTAGDILGGTVRQGPQATPAPATKVAGITVNITNTQNMDPNAMVGVLLPALRRAAVRGLA